MNPDRHRDYRSYPAVSNSDLTEFRDVLFPRPARSLANAFATGEVLHRCLLEGEALPPQADLPPGVSATGLTTLLLRARRDPFLRWALRFGVKEKAHYFRDEATGLPCKCRTDLLWRNRLIVDVKTTSQPNREAFVESCRAYEYHRQAAFYLDGTGARRFMFVGLQKKTPYDVFYYEITADAAGRELLAEGRGRYRRLLDELHARQYRPRSWRVEED